MSPVLLGCVAAGGLVGAPARHLADRAVSRRVRARPTRFQHSAVPFGTLAINLSGSLLLGLVTGLGLAGVLGPAGRTLIGTGFCGAFTTFSTWTYETVRLVEEDQWPAALANVLVSIGLGLLAAAAGLALGLVA